MDITMAAAGCGAGSQRNSTGSMHNPTSTCSATSHHNQHCVAGASRGKLRHSSHTTATSSAACTLRGQQPLEHRSHEGVHVQLPFRLDCSFSTSACSAASSSSLTLPRRDIQATSGLTEPCSVFSTKAPTAWCTTSFSPVVVE